MHAALPPLSCLLVESCEVIRPADRLSAGIQITEPLTSSYIYFTDSQSFCRVGRHSNLNGLPWNEVCNTVQWPSRGTNSVCRSEFVLDLRPFYFYSVCYTRVFLVKGAIYATRSNPRRSRSGGRSHAGPPIKSLFSPSQSTVHYRVLMQAT